MLRRGLLPAPPLFAEDNMIVRTLEVGMLGANCYLVVCPQTRQALVVDPGGDADLILEAAAGRGPSQVHRGHPAISTTFWPTPP
jgi:glyoxylase-like metal-dependent hydrolase (beta-lactamase superfamily II)